MNAFTSAGDAAFGAGGAWQTEQARDGTRLHPARRFAMASISSPPMSMPKA